MSIGRSGVEITIDAYTPARELLQHISSAHTFPALSSPDNAVNRGGVHLGREHRVFVWKCQTILKGTVHAPSRQTGPVEGPGGHREREPLPLPPYSNT